MSNNGKLHQSELLMKQRNKAGKIFIKLITDPNKKRMEHGTQDEKRGLQVQHLKNQDTLAEEQSRRDWQRIDFDILCWIPGHVGLAGNKQVD